MPDTAMHDVLIVGAGPVGLALALALKDAGLDIVLADARPRDAVAGDPRDLALAHGSQLTLQHLGAWDALPATPIEHIHISQQGGLGRTLIDAVEHDLPALGYVASAGALASTLRAAVDAAGIPVLDETEVVNLAPGATEVIASLAGAGRPATILRARLAVCAEGGLRAGDANVVEMDLNMGAEDFSFYAREVPGFFFFVGATPKGRDPLTAPSNHSPEFFLDEEALKVGTRAMLQVVLDYQRLDD